MRAFFLLWMLALPTTLPVHYEQDLLQARKEKAKVLTGPRSWFSLVALQPLVQGDISVGSAAGNTLQLAHGLPHAFTLHMAEGKVTFAAVSPPLTVGDRHPHVGDVVPISDASEASLAWSGLWANVIRRTGDQIYLRVGDPHSPNLEHFHGLNFYPVDPAYRIEARWIPFASPHPIRMGTVLGTTLLQSSPGYAEFELNHETVRIEATGNEHGLAFSFRDGTYKTTTYGAGRELEAGSPSNGLTRPGTVVLDFNQAGNWPCAYTAYGTCPLPPPQNRFAAEIPAGEKRYHD